MAVTINGTTGILAPDIGIDGTTLTVDAVNDRVGIGITNPDTKLTVKAGNGDQLRLDNAGERYTQISLRNNGTQKAAIWLDETEDLLSLYAASGYGIKFLSNATERLRITSSGELVSTNGTLRRDVSSSSFTVSGDTASNAGANINLYGASHSSLANVFRVRTGSTERLRIDSSGRTLINLTSSLLSYAGLQIKGDADLGAHICLANKTAAPEAGHNIGSIRFTNNAGGIGALIGVEGDGTWSGSSQPSRIILATTASGATAASERIRITSDGRQYHYTDGSLRMHLNATGLGVNTSTITGGRIIHAHNTGAGSAYFQSTNSNTGEGANSGALFGMSGTTCYAPWNYTNGDIIMATNQQEALRITASGIVKIDNPGMASGTSAANALLQIKATGQYDGLVLGNAYSQGAIGTNSQGALIYTGNAAPANLGGGLKHTHIWYSGSSGGGAPSEKMSLATDGTLYLGPYDAPGAYTSVPRNVPYQIKVAPYGWQHHSEIAAISMGSHQGTGQDDGQIVFKTATNVHSDSTGLREVVRITEDGHLNLQINATRGKFTMIEGTSTKAFSLDSNGANGYFRLIDEYDGFELARFHGDGALSMNTTNLTNYGQSSNSANTNSSGTTGNWSWRRDTGAVIQATDADSGWALMYLNKYEWGFGDDNRWISFYLNGAARDTISWNGSNVVFGGGSDYRIKKNIRDFTSGIDKVKQLKVHTFDYIETDRGNDHVGFIAHELQEIVPEAVSGEKDGMRKDEETGDDVIAVQMVDYGRLTPVLTAALQEALAKIETLEARITALEG